MTANVIFDIEVADAEGYEDYKKLSSPAVAGQRFSKAIGYQSVW